MRQGAVPAARAGGWGCDRRAARGGSGCSVWGDHSLTREEREGESVELRDRGGGGVIAPGGREHGAAPGRQAGRMGRQVAGDGRASGLLAGA